MSFEFLLPLETYPDATPKAGLPRALDFAAALHGQLTLAPLEVVIPPISSALGDVLIDVPALVKAAEAKSRANGAALVTEARALAAKLGLPIDERRICCRTEFAADRLAALARTYDMTLLVRSSEAPSDIAEGVLFGAGGPLVLFPDHETPAHLNHVAVAWDGSRAAARAVHDALPVLAIAKSVTILTASDDKAIDADQVADLQRLLSRHDIASDHASAEAGTEQIGERLQRAALARGAGLLVMGGYGHSRLREFVLGGATRGALGDVRLPILMSH